MNSIQRIERIELLKKQALLMKKAYLDSPKEMTQYYEVLKEIEKIQRIEDGFQDIMVFAKNYFMNVPEPHNLLKPESPSPAFHYELAEELRKMALSPTTYKIVASAPRSHSKTTICSQIFLLWVIAYQEDLNQPYWMLINAKQEGAAEFLDVIKAEVEDNELFIADFGDLKGKDKWNSGMIITKNNVKISAHGAGEAIRGKRYLSARPNVIIDDLETNESCETPERIAKNMDFINRTVENLGDPEKSKIVMIGTVISYGSCLNQIINNSADWKAFKYKAIVKFPDRMDLWEKWQSIYEDRSEGASPELSTRIARDKAIKFYEENKEEMERGCVQLWKERISLFRLMEMRAQNRFAFNTEQQNEPIDQDTAIFKKVWKYTPEEVNLDELDIYGACDPSLGQSKRSDPSCIITVGRHKKSGIVYVIDVDVKRRHPDQIIQDIFNKARQFDYVAFSIETVAFQEFMRDELLKRSAQQGVYIPVQAYKSTTKKELRIAALEPLVSSGYIRLLPVHQNLETELLYFPKAAHDDASDCLAQVMELAKKNYGSFSFGKI